MPRQKDLWEKSAAGGGEPVLRMAFMVRGRVQGVGFRPFVWRLATSLGLDGHVANSLDGVEICVQGGEPAVRAFASRLRAEAPPLSVIDRVEERPLQPEAGRAGFHIAPSLACGDGLRARGEALPGPDAGVCDACLADMRQPGGRRRWHAFANCTDCGPRFSIARRMPYDRANTSMSCFAMCAACAAEYSDPANRRFHAQPIACPACGPVLTFAAGSGRPGPGRLSGHAALLAAAGRIRAGGIVALKGIGGFQLACDARSDMAVSRLRQLKTRPTRAFAVMAPDLSSAGALADLSRIHADLLSGPERPIVLAPERPDSGLSPFVSPDAPLLGLMLPTAPLHAALLDCLSAGGAPFPALVMTSGNRPGEPICLGNREALASLDGIADGWLMHDRDIAARVDDSVAMAGISGPMLLRRARGYVPLPVGLPAGLSHQPVLGAGGQLKAAFCLTRGGKAWPGQHIGDLEAPSGADFYRQALAHLEDLLGVSPRAVVCDAHPDYFTTAFAEKYARDRSIPLFRLQHHVAHAAAVLGENGRSGPALALILDGTGLGSDGRLWGGEILRVDIGAGAWVRLGGLAPFELPGGEAAIRQPWRIAVSLLRQAGLPPPGDLGARRGYSAVCAMLDKSFNCPLSSGCGRLFDGISALLGLCRESGYEGHAAMLMEKAARGARGGRLWRVDLIRKDGLWLLDSCGFARSAWHDLRDGIPVGEIALSFHRALARGLAALVRRAAGETGGHEIGLAGGAMQNGLLSELLGRELELLGLAPLWPRDIPPGDGGLAYGQAVWGAARLAAR